MKIVCLLISGFSFRTAVAKEREVEGDLILADLGNGLPFRAGTFDGAISISTLQWLCNADKSDHNPVKRLYTFFSSLFACLVSIPSPFFQFHSIL